MKKYDAIVIGSGFAGATAARLLAEKDKKVLIIEERNHIGGNAYDCYDDKGIFIHLYGPHIFHTNSLKVFEFLKRFAEFKEYHHKVIGNIDGTLVPVPFNYTALETLFPKEEADEIKAKLNEQYKGKTRVSILDLLSNEDPIIHRFGEYVYEKVFAYYTAKQWEIPVDKIDKSVISRVPVIMGYEDTYFGDTYQYMPVKGFIEIFNNMLNHPNIEVKLNQKAEDLLRADYENGKIYFMDEAFEGPIIFSGPIDRFMNYEFGVLPYRSLRLQFESYPVTYYQPASVVNYNTSEKFTRISEFKYLTGQQKEGMTTILKEYPLKFDINNPDAKFPYYSINNADNNALYNKYKEKISRIKNFHLCGRLAEYRYYNMDAATLRAMELVEELEK